MIGTTLAPLDQMVCGVGARQAADVADATVTSDDGRRQLAPSLRAIRLVQFIGADALCRSPAGWPVQRRLPRHYVRIFLLWIGNLIDTLATLWLVGNDLVTTFLGQRMRNSGAHRVLLPASGGDDVVDGGAVGAREQFYDQRQLAFLGQFRSALLFGWLAIADWIGFFNSHLSFRNRWLFRFVCLWFAHDGFLSPA